MGNLSVTATNNNAAENHNQQQQQQQAALNNAQQLMMGNAGGADGSGLIIGGGGVLGVANNNNVSVGGSSINNNNNGGVAAADGGNDMNSFVMMNMNFMGGGNHSHNDAVGVGGGGGGIAGLDGMTNNNNINNINLMMNNNSNSQTNNVNNLSIPPKLRNKNKLKQTFAMKLMNILSIDQCQSAIRWMPNGLAFCIVDPKELVENVLPIYFKEAKYTSFVSFVFDWVYSFFLMNCLMHYTSSEIEIIHQIIINSPIGRKVCKA